MTPPDAPRRSFLLAKLAIAALSIAIAIGGAEALLRWALFDTTFPLAAKDASYYARDLDELWIYRRLFSPGRRWAGAAERPGDTRIAFYRDWAASLVPDAELGYVRRADFRMPCHETTRLATRGIHDYAPDGPKLLFFGDSFVESAACSDDTLTAKIERLTGVDTLNYGIGGYGLDQIALYFERVRPTCDRADCLFLIGLIPNDFERVLLKVRSGPKPYFTVDGDALRLHTDHIHVDALDDYFRRPPGHFYLYEFLRGRFGRSQYAGFLDRTEDERRTVVEATSRLLFRRFAAAARAGAARVAFVLFPQPGVPFDPALLAAMREAGLPVIDLRSCLRDSGRPDVDLYAELHPTSLGNELLARCIVRDLAVLQAGR